MLTIAEFMGATFRRNSFGSGAIVFVPQHLLGLSYAIKS
jgi:hypothetical protein